VQTAVRVTKSNRSPGPVDARSAITVMRGPAIVHLPDGKTFEGDTIYDGRAVSMDGWPRVISGPDHDRRATYRARVNRTWPIGRVEEIRWLKEAA